MFQLDSQSTENSVLGSQANTIPQGSQPDTLEWLPRQIHELTTIIQAMQHPAMSMVLATIPQPEADQLYYCKLLYS